MKTDSQHLVTVTLITTEYDTSEERIFDLFMEIQDIFEEVILDQKLGSLDGHEFCITPDQETLTYFIYGFDPEKIVNTITPLLSSLPKSTKPQIHTSRSL